MQAVPAPVQIRPIVAGRCSNLKIGLAHAPLMKDHDTPFGRRFSPGKEIHPSMNLRWIGRTLQFHILVCPGIVGTALPVIEGIDSVPR